MSRWPDSGIVEPEDSFQSSHKTKPMTLPDSEIKRIKEKTKTHWCGAVRMEEALLWYERMGKFAEMQGVVTIGVASYEYDKINSLWVEYDSIYSPTDRTLTTPELITEFLNQLNEGK